MISKKKIVIIGLGYVGLPLALEFGKKRTTIGFDIDENKILNLKKFNDSTNETSKKNFEDAKKLIFTNDMKDIMDCEIFIITVPTPLDNHNKPDLKHLKEASCLVGSILKKNNIVIYESTVYPGVTEDICVPILEKKSGLVFNKDFFCGYSPERINPGDKKHRLTNTKKITSGSNSEISKEIDNLYKEIITVGTYMCPSIKVAEAAKIIENVQRDVNIALINELSILFNKLGIDTQEILKAASTKWNFSHYKPGLVGGHCIGVDPYYLAHKALEIGYRPEMILAGRKINDSMSYYVVDEVVKIMKKKNIELINAKVLILGFTFKENCPDIRNTKVIDIVKQLNKYNLSVDIYDPWVSNEEVKKEYKIEMINYPQRGAYDAIILAVAHDKFNEMGIDKVKQFGKKLFMIYDVKYLFPSNEVDGSL